MGGGIGFTVLGGILSSVGRPNGTTGASSGAATTTATATAQAPDDWTSFMRDARNTGHNPEASGPTAAPAVRWSFSRKETDGKDNSFGFTAPTVVQDRVYVGGRNRLWAIDANDGSVRWTYDPQHQGSDGDVLTVAVSEGTVFAGTDHGRVVAVDAETGTEQWRRQVGGSDKGHSEGKADRIWSLTVTGGTVFAGEDGVLGETPRLHALDAKSGADRWDYCLGPESGINSRQPPPPPVADGTAYMIGTNELVALDTKTGEVEWKRDEPGYSSFTLAYVDGTIYAPGGEFSNTFYAIDAEDGSTTWTHTFEAPDMQTWQNPAVDGEAVYTGGFSDDHMTKVVSLDAGDGSRLWTKPVSTIGSAGLDGETLYLTSGSQSGVHARNPDDGQHLWSYVDIEDVSAPAVVGATVYIGGATKVVALGPA